MATGLMEEDAPMLTWGTNSRPISGGLFTCSTTTDIRFTLAIGKNYTNRGHNYCDVRTLALYCKKLALVCWT